MFIDDGNILSSGPSYRVVASTLSNWYRECIRWLQKVGLSIESEKTEIIFYGPHKSRHGNHCERPASLTIPTEDGRETTIQSCDNVRYLGFFINHKLNWHKHVNIMAARTLGSLKALRILGNSVRGLGYMNWQHWQAYNVICLPVLTYGSPVWFNWQKQLSAKL